MAVGLQRRYKSLFLLLDPKYKDHRLVLLYRFHITIIIVNLLAFGIDMFSGRYYNAVVESAAVAALFFNLWRLHAYSRLKEAVFLFLGIISALLFTLIYINHFATMSVVFVLLLPLTTLLFIKLRYSVLIEAIMFVVMALLLYGEYLNNPDNPLVQNPQALFHLAYAAAIIYIFGLLYHFSIRKTFDELDSANRQKEILLSEVHHRVKNNLNVIASIIGLQANALKGDEKEHLLKSKTRIESIAMVHEMLYKSEDFAGIDFASYMNRLSGILLAMFSPKQNVKVEIHAKREILPLEVMIQLGIMVNELLTNSIKYAFEEDGGIITMELYRHNGQCVFIYSDDGIGVDDPDTLAGGKSLGIKLINLTAKQLGGSVKISSLNGLKYEIGFNYE